MRATARRAARPPPRPASSPPPARNLARSHRSRRTTRPARSHRRPAPPAVGGGISRARSCTIAPRASPAGASASARLTRTRGGRATGCPSVSAPCPIGASVSRTSFARRPAARRAPPSPENARRSSAAPAPVAATLLRPPPDQTRAPAPPSAAPIASDTRRTPAMPPSRQRTPAPLAASTQHRRASMPPDPAARTTARSRRPAPPAATAPAGRAPPPASARRHARRQPPIAARRICRRARSRARGGDGCLAIVAIVSSVWEHARLSARSDTGRPPTRPHAVVTRFAPSPTGYPASRRRAHRAVQLAVRAASRRQVPAADRGYRPRALDPAGDRRDPRRHALARARLGRRRRLSSSRAPSATPQVAHEMVANGARLSLLHDQRRDRRDARRGAGREEAAPHPHRRGAIAPEATRRTRPTSSACKAPHRRRDDDRRPRPGRGHGPERRDRRPRPAPLGRHADLYARGGRRRSRHGRDARHPRRRSSQQRVPPVADLSARWAGPSRSMRTSR